MILYTRSGDRVVINWTPKKTDIGKQAVSAVLGPVESYPADVTDEEAEKIREEYRRLVDQQTDGGTN